MKRTPPSPPFRTERLPNAFATEGIRLAPTPRNHRRWIDRVAAGAAAAPLSTSSGGGPSLHAEHADSRHPGSLHAHTRHADTSRDCVLEDGPDLGPGRGRRGEAFESAEHALITLLTIVVVGLGWAAIELERDATARLNGYSSAPGWSHDAAAQPDRPDRVGNEREGSIDMSAKQ